jgi:hypothetical protein
MAKVIVKKDKKGKIVGWQSGDNQGSNNWVVKTDLINLFFKIKAPGSIIPGL